MKAEIVSIGTELLMGELADTNSRFLASQLPALGIQLQYICQVGDDLATLTETLARGMARSDIVFTTGGLGPTQDDLTREAIARLLGEEPEVQSQVLEGLRAYFRGRGMEMPAANVRQATLIPSATLLPNPRGTAPGWWAEKDSRYIVAMPGPPGEMMAMWQEQVVPRLKERSRGQVIITRNIKTNGLSEAEVDQVVTPWLGQENPYLGIYAKADGIHLRVIGRGSTEEAARQLIAPVEQGILGVMQSYVWGFDEETPSLSAGQLLSAQGLTLATMEACTGGMLASALGEVPGSRAYFQGGLVTPTLQALVAAGIPAGTIEAQGMVSPEVASAMAACAQRSLGADIGIGLTGVAEPSQGEEGPLGLVHIALARHETAVIYTHRLPPRREVIMRRAVSIALIELVRSLKASAPSIQA